MTQKPVKKHYEVVNIHPEYATEAERNDAWAEASARVNYILRSAYTRGTLFKKEESAVV